MATINVRRDVTDAFYRYKMERLQTKIEGKGNGIKTVVVNLASVARTLDRDPNYVIKYFAFELGAQTNTDPKDDRWIINGAHEAAKLQDLLDGFIKKFVLCKKCSNPETDFVINDPHILLDCKACGQRTDVDLRLKLSGFIIKHQSKKGKDKAARKAERRAKKASGNVAGNVSDDDDEGDDDAPTNGHAASDEDADAPIFNDKEVEVRDDEWAVDMSEEAVKARQARLPDEFKQKLSLEDVEDGEGGGHSTLDELGNWIISQGEEKGSIDNVDSVEVYLKAKELGVESKHKTVGVLVQALFDDNVLAQIPKRAAMLKQIITSDKHEKALLGGTERLLAGQVETNPSAFAQIVKILQLYYHHDLVSEETAIHWSTKLNTKYTDRDTGKKIRKAAEPFIIWLQEADEEESEEESEEDDE